MSQPKGERTSRQSESVGHRLVSRVAAAAGRDPLDMPVLAERIDLDALESLVSSRSQSLSVRFRYAGRRVTVRGDGRIELGPPPETDLSVGS